MGTVAQWFKIDGEHVAGDLQGARETLHDANSEVVLDFSAVPRIDPPGIKALQEFATRADEDSVKVVLQGVGVEVYKVLKLVGVVSRFSFVTGTPEAARPKPPTGQSGE